MRSSSLHVPLASPLASASNKQTKSKESSVDALVRGARKGMHGSKRSRQRLCGIFSFSSMQHLQEVHAVYV
jgi:hypothetical protein